MSEVTHQDSSSIRGDVHITEREILTDEKGSILYDENGRPLLGKIVGEFEEKNIILDQGRRLFLRAASGDINSTVKTIKIGKDVGTGTLLNPQQPVGSLTETAQDVVYTTPEAEFFVTYPTTNSVRYLATINGANVMTGYPTLPNVVYTSASIYTLGGKSITYKRFPARTISSLISVDISWTITLT